MKFGGTSLEDVSGFDRVARLLQSSAAHDDLLPVAVASAMSGVTDALMTTVRLTQENRRADAARSLEYHLARHLEVAVAYGSIAASKMNVIIEDARREILKLLEVDRISDVNVASSRDAARRDEISSYGEILSARLLSLVLNEYGLPAVYIDARSCIKTNAEHGNAKPLAQPTTLHTRTEVQPLLDQKRLPVLGGFIGATLAGVTTTMGRGSSNHTATLVSAALDARETHIWTDVDGVHTADPRLVKQARTISHLSYDEAEEMARLGARVLHQRMFDPVRVPEIPIRIRNTHLPHAEGTLISSFRARREGLASGTIKGIAHRNHLVRIDISSTPALTANGFQRSIEAVFNRHQIPMEIVSRSVERLSVACDKDTLLEPIIAGLSRYGSVALTNSQAIVGCVGEGLHATPDALTKMTEVLKSFDSTLEWQKLSGINLVSVVDADLAEPLVRRLHQEIFEAVI